MKVIRCDRCGKEIPRGGTAAILAVRFTDPLRGTMFKDDALGNDLCDECVRELGEWMHGKEHAALDPLDDRRQTLMEIRGRYVKEAIAELEREQENEEHTSN